jgi:hypothetical protein
MNVAAKSPISRLYKLQWNNKNLSHAKSYFSDFGGAVSTNIFVLGWRTSRLVLHANLQPFQLNYERFKYQL